jgi:DNA-binding HxlR family transcriptional regulator
MEMKKAAITGAVAAPTPDEKSRRSNCPVGCTLDILGDRWTLLVIRDLLAGKKRYGEFAASPERIPTNILADRLKRLEREGLISSARYSEHPPRLEYSLTEEGNALRPAIDAIAEWGLRHFPGTKRAIARLVQEGDQTPS